MSQLRTLYREYRGTEYGDQLAQEIVAKVKSTPVPSKKVAVPREIFKLNNAALEQELLDALYAGEKGRVDAAYFELQRRQANKKAKKRAAKSSRRASRILAAQSALKFRTTWASCRTMASPAVCTRISP